MIATGFDRKPDDPYYRNQTIIAPTNVIEVPEEIKIEEALAEAEPVVEEAAPVKEVSLEEHPDLGNPWDVFKKR